MKEMMQSALEIDAAKARGAQVGLGPPLTGAQLKKLPDGAFIWVIWSGGNGPHRYRLRFRLNRIYASLDDVVFHELDDIGPRQPSTQVWRERGCHLTPAAPS